MRGGGGEGLKREHERWGGGEGLKRDMRKGEGVFEEGT